MSESTRGATRQSGNKAANKEEAGNNGKENGGSGERRHKKKRGWVPAKGVNAAAVD